MMYVHVWNKYLPIIKILMKRAATTNQSLDLNRIDFEKAGSGRKAGYKFSIEFKQGKVANVISSSPLATDLAAVLMNDPASKTIMANIDVTISLNPKFQLFIVNKNAADKPKEEEPKEEELQLHNSESAENLN
jgi:hypothetical protein